jgi:hypothetical protein
MTNCSPDEPARAADPGEPDPALAPAGRTETNDVDREFELIRRALSNETFIQNVTILILGALVTGILAPMLIDHYKQ